LVILKKFLKILLRLVISNRAVLVGRGEDSAQEFLANFAKLNSGAHFMAQAKE
jgi:hypothetical protein